MLSTVLQQMKTWFSTHKTTLLIATSALLGAVIALGIPMGWKWLTGTTPSPAPVVNREFVPVGRTYLTELGKTYAAAWVEGAKALEAGQPVSSALKTVAQEWDRGRTELFNRLLTPEFSRIVPEGQADDGTKAQARQAMALAWRGLAAGLTSRNWLITWP